MKKRNILSLNLYVLLFSALISCSTPPSSNKEEKEEMETTTATPNNDKTNLLLAEWTGKYGGTPAFDKMKLQDLKPAILKGMELNLTQIDAITSNQDAPTFENTIIPMEKAGEELNRVFAYYGIAMNLMETVWKASTARVKEEVTDMQAIADKNGDKITIEPWDYRFYAEKVRKEKYDLNSDEIKQYLPIPSPNINV